jgi:ATP-binding cassette subfamily B protein
MKQRSTLSRLYTYLYNYRFGYIVGTLIQVGASITFQLLIAYLVRGLTDAGLSGDVPLIIRVTMISSAIAGGVVLIVPWGVRQRSVAAERAALDLRQDLFVQVNHLPQKYMEQTHSGDIVSRLTNDVTAAKDAFSDIMVQLLQVVASGIVFAVYLFTLSWELALITLAVGLIPIGFNRWMGRPLRRVSHEAQASLSSLNSRLRDLLAGMSVIRVFQQEERFLGEYGAANQTALAIAGRRARLQAAVNALNDFLGFQGLICVMIAGTYFIMTDRLSAGQAITAIQVMQHVLRPFLVLGDLWARIQQALAGADRIFEIMDQEPEQLPAPQTEVEVGNGAALRLTNVSFSYDTKAVLTDVSLEVPQGKVTALAGPSGGGKSTLFKLLLGLYPCTEGTIAVLGRDINGYDLQALRQLIAFVPQDSYLYSGTIYDNIAWGRPEGASEAEVIAAAKAANAHDFIMQLPNGYQTKIGERGTQLSGGQRQRLSIARAILKDAPILLLDEATSSLDTEAEALVQEALNRLMQGRTTLVIAHRLSTIRNADCIHVIADGKVAESGTHEELLALDGIYRYLHDLQEKEVA